MSAVRMLAVCLLGWSALWSSAASADDRSAQRRGAAAVEQVEVEAATSEATTSEATAVGTHGMLLFGGRDGLFASHLPMYHPPHDTQVVLRIRFVDTGIERELGDTLAAEPAVWTLVPERFDLLRLAPNASRPIGELRVDVVEGHFERGGTRRHAGVLLTVESVPLFRRLDPTLRAPNQLDYLRIAASPSAAEQFLLLRIDARPGADQLLAAPGVVLPTRLTLPASGELAASAQAIETALGGGLDLREIYLETGDLR